MRQPRKRVRRGTREKRCEQRGFLSSSQQQQQQQQIQQQQQQQQYGARRRLTVRTAYYYQIIASQMAGGPQMQKRRGRAVGRPHNAADDAATAAGSRTSGSRERCLTDMNSYMQMAMMNQLARLSTTTTTTTTTTNFDDGRMRAVSWCNCV